MKRYTLALIAFGLICIGLVSGCNNPQATDTAQKSSGTTSEIVASDEAPPLETDNASNALNVGLASYDELQKQIKDLSGKVVVVDIWSTSCLPCMEEFPNLVELSKKDPERLACISFNVDFMGLPRETVESHRKDIESFLEKKEASTVINLISTEPDTVVLAKYQVESMPAIMIIDQTGKMVAKATDANASSGGLSYANDILPKIEELLASPTP